MPILLPKGAALTLIGNSDTIGGGGEALVRYLVNDASIAQIPLDTVTYWHVELPTHDVIPAEGLAAESYLDTGNRRAFANGNELRQADLVRRTASCQPA
jgi:hypothetical protein